MLFQFVFLFSGHNIFNSVKKSLDAPHFFIFCSKEPDFLLIF